MIRNRFLLLLVLPMLMLAGCGKDGTEPQTPDTGDTGAIKFEIGFAGQDGTQTRVATAADFNSEWEDGDKIGIFAVEGGTSLAASGNPIHNVPLTYNETDGTWSGDASWPDGAAALDFYAYYPYDAEATDPTAIAFAVKADQSGATDSNYNRSDLLTARSYNDGAGWTEDETVNLTFTHMLAMVQLAIDKTADGIDFNEEMTVTLRGVKTAAPLNLSVGPSMAVGDAGDVVMYLAATDGTKRLYRALIPMQTVAAGAKLFRIENGGRKLTSDALTAEMTLTPSIAQTFTLSGGGGTPGDPQTITPASLTGIDAPATGAAPDTSGDDTDEYTVTSIEWRDNNGVFTGSAFAAGTNYTAEITLTAQAGWQFAINPGITDNIDKLVAWTDYLDDFVFVGSGTTFTIVGDYSETSYTTVTFRVLLPATAGSSTTAVTPSRIAFSAVPETGAAVGTVAVSDGSDQFDSAIDGWEKSENGGDWAAWSGTDFGAETEYRAKIVLTRTSTDYSFESFTNIASIRNFLPDGETGGAFVSNAAATLTFWVRFPATGGGNIGFDGNIGIGDNGTEQDWVNP